MRYLKRDQLCTVREWFAAHGFVGRVRGVPEESSTAWDWLVPTGPIKPVASQHRDTGRMFAHCGMGAMLYSVGCYSSKEDNCGTHYALSSGIAITVEREGFDTFLSFAIPG